MVMVQEINFNNIVAHNNRGLFIFNWSSELTGFGVISLKNSQFFNTTSVLIFDFDHVFHDLTHSTFEIDNVFIGDLNKQEYDNNEYHELMLFSRTNGATIRNLELRNLNVYHNLCGNELKNRCRSLISFRYSTKFNMDSSKFENVQTNLGLLLLNHGDVTITNSRFISIIPTTTSLVSSSQANSITMKKLFVQNITCLEGGPFLQALLAKDIYIKDNKFKDFHLSRGVFDIQYSTTLNSYNNNFQHIRTKLQGTVYYLKSVHDTNIQFDQYINIVSEVDSGTLYFIKNSVAKITYVFGRIIRGTTIVVQDNSDVKLSDSTFFQINGDPGLFGASLSTIVLDNVALPLHQIDNVFDPIIKMDRMHSIKIKKLNLDHISLKNQVLIDFTDTTESEIHLEELELFNNTADSIIRFVNCYSAKFINCRIDNNRASLGGSIQADARMKHIDFSEGKTTIKNNWSDVAGNALVFDNYISFENDVLPEMIDNLKYTERRIFLTKNVGFQYVDKFPKEYITSYPKSLSIKNLPWNEEKKAYEISTLRESNITLDVTVLDIFGSPMNEFAYLNLHLKDSLERFQNIKIVNDSKPTRFEVSFSQIGTSKIVDINIKAIIQDANGIGNINLPFDVSTNVIVTLEECPAGYTIVEDIRDTSETTYYSCAKCPRNGFSLSLNSTVCVTCKTPCVVPKENQTEYNSAQYNLGYWAEYVTQEKRKLDKNVQRELQVWKCLNSYCGATHVAAYDNGISNVCHGNRNSSYFICAVCNEGYSEWFGRCIDCQKGFNIFFAFVAFVPVAFIQGVYYHFSSSNKASSAPVKILIVFFQTFSILVLPYLTAQINIGGGIFKFITDIFDGSVNSFFDQYKSKEQLATVQTYKQPLIDKVFTKHFKCPYARGSLHHSFDTFILAFSPLIFILFWALCVRIWSIFLKVFYKIKSCIFPSSSTIKKHRMRQNANRKRNEVQKVIAYFRKKLFSNSAFILSSINAMTLITIPVLRSLFRMFPWSFNYWSSSGTHLVFYSDIQIENVGYWLYFVFFIIPFTFIFVVSFCSLFFIIRRSFKRPDSKSARFTKAYLGSIYTLYRRECWWFEFIHFSRKLLLAMILSIYEPPKAYIGLVYFIPFQSCTIALMVVNLALVVHFQPYRRKVDNVAEIICYIIIIIGISVTSDTKNDPLVASIVLLVVFTLFSLLFVTYTIVSNQVIQKLIKFILNLPRLLRSRIEERRINNESTELEEVLADEINTFYEDNITNGNLTDLLFTEGNFSSDDDQVE